MQVDTVLPRKALKLVERTEGRLFGILGRQVKVTIEFSDTCADPKIIEIKRLRAAVCETLDITWEQIIGLRRQQEISDARFIYWHLSKKHLKRGVVSLADECNRTHAAVINALDVVKDRLYVKDEKTVNAIKAIEKLIGKA